jgi:hypothetical protein
MMRVKCVRVFVDACTVLAQLIDSLDAAGTCAPPPHPGGEGSACSALCGAAGRSILTARASHIIAQRLALAYALLVTILVAQRLRARVRVCVCEGGREGKGGREGHTHTHTHTHTHNP